LEELMAPLDAVVLVGTLKGGPAASSSEKLGREVADALGKHGVSCEVIRVATGAATRTLAANTAHLAGLLHTHPYPPQDNGHD
jgi:hypothetical protein